MATPGENPSVSVDLGGPRAVTEVIFRRRTGFGDANTVGLRFSVNEHKSNPLHGEDPADNAVFTECENPNVGNLPVPVMINCGGAVGRYVHAFLVGSNK